MAIGSIGIGVGGAMGIGVAGLRGIGVGGFGGFGGGAAAAAFRTGAGGICIVASCGVAREIGSEPTRSLGDVSEPRRLGKRRGAVLMCCWFHSV